MVGEKKERHRPGHGADHAAVYEEQSRCAPYASSALPLEHHKPAPRRNFRDADWKDFDGLDNYLVAHPLPPLSPRSSAEIDAYGDALTAAMTAVIEELVPLSRKSTYARRWWNKELSPCGKPKIEPQVAQTTV
ncbi:hypothetical protein B0H13DRAFT_2332322 [Mycena leptocephala]|nr:hypothetical protein B0H13DRAFT_2332322 [Mycena leptocephala]